MKSKYEIKKKEKKGLLRLYRDGYEVRCVKYYNKERLNALMQMWQTEIAPLKGKAEYHISIEPETE